MRHSISIYPKPKRGSFIRRSALRVIEDPRVEKKLRDVARRERTSLLMTLDRAVTAALDEEERAPRKRFQLSRRKL
jgi:hypothetical protein